MKNYLLILLLTISFPCFSQQWITDQNFEHEIHSTHPFGDDDVTITVVEFWADFNKQNEFKEWRSLRGVTYLRCDVVKTPLSRKKYNVRMAPTLLIFVDGVLEESYKSSLDLELHADLGEIQRRIDDLRRMSKF